ncbi:Uu.00g083530.m01.CDS01 [Anthostomella pinea]|uniref:Uu.00g083530.m01.CDS01 n=1 Tax=Anthostomella pinea TaxID=933095 RepID=A0AAI8VM95_9PEZI|nr:Uu.00g083530.m01.CDS01 [Anthostomella pinea]
MAPCDPDLVDLASAYGVCTNPGALLPADRKYDCLLSFRYQGGTDKGLVEHVVNMHPGGNCFFPGCGAGEGPGPGHLAVGGLRDHLRHQHPVILVQVQVLEPQEPQPQPQQQGQQQQMVLVTKTNHVCCWPGCQKDPLEGSGADRCVRWHNYTELAQGLAGDLVLANEEGEALESTDKIINTAGFMINSALHIRLRKKSKKRSPRHWVRVQAYGESVGEDAGYYIALKRVCHTQLLTEAAAAVGIANKPIDPEQAGYTRQMSTPGFMHMQFVSGITGTATVNALANRPEYTEIYTLSRSQKSEHSSKVKHATLDLQSSADSMAQPLSHIPPATHIYFCAYLADLDEAEATRINSAMLTNFLAALQSFVLTCGLKQYGVHLGQPKNPMREDDDPALFWLEQGDRPPNFYYAQQRILEKAAAEAGGKWS